MAKQKRGRPRGSKNKNLVAIAGKPGNVAKMEVAQLRAYIDGLEEVFTAKVTQQRQILEGQLAGLQGYVSSKAAGVLRTVLQVPRTGSRAKAKPKYQSKKHKRLKWSGRGMLPLWMRDEMKNTKLTKDDFLIK